MIGSYYRQTGTMIPKMGVGRLGHGAAIWPPNIGVWDGEGAGGTCPPPKKNRENILG